jgi:murein DD-endopeptidase MepM/ murein hydrolase activator NlpD
MKNLLQIVCSIVLSALFFPCAPAQQPISITWMPESLASGSPCLFLVESPSAGAISGVWQGHKFSFFRTGSDRNLWYAVAGVDVTVKPGEYELALDITKDGATQTLRRMVSISPASYKEIPLTVPEKFVEPNAQAQRIIAADQKIKRKVFADSADAQLWSGDFLSPLQSAPSTDSFGTRRVFNGSLASVHRGLDYRAKPGTPVRASNTGRVVLARPLYYEGNCVIIDHGLGWMTIYMHLSKLNVKAGQKVKRGQLIALSGKTGRATGPHLHLSVRWQGEYLDPAKLFALNLPAATSSRSLN